MQQKIENIIFDLGGVLLNINYQLTIEAFEKLGVTNFVELYSQAQQTSVFDDLETGKIAPKEFYEQIRKLANLPLTDAEIEYAWNAMLLDLPQARIEFLKELKPEYRTFLFSNTNAIHLTAFSNIIEKQHGFRSLDTLFENVYFSHTLGERKPNVSGFLAICEMNNLDKSKTLFIDDSIQHVEGAKAAGIHAVFLDTNETDIITLLSTYLKNS